MATKVGKFAKKALGWIGKAIAWFGLVPPGLIDPKVHAKVTKVLERLLKGLETAESTAGAHTVFWPTIEEAPKGALIFIVYPNGDQVDLHQDTVAYLKLFKKAFDEIKKLK